MWIRDSRVDELRQHVEVGLGELVELAPALDLGDDLVLVADRLQHARVGREAGLAAALLRQPELLEQHLAELLGRADDELLARQVPDLLLERRGSPPATRSVISRQAVDVQPDAGDLHVAQDGTSGSSMSSRSDAGRARRAARAARRPGPGRAGASAAGGSSTSAASPRSSRDLAEREAAAGGLEQEGGQQRVVHERCGGTTPSALASWAMTGRSPSAATTSSGAPRSPTSTSPPAATPKRQRSLLGEQLALGRPRARARRARARRRRAERARRRRASPSRRPRGDRRLGRRRRRGRLGGRRAPPPGAAAGRAARTRGRPRAGASGRARGRPRRRVDVDRDVALDRRQELGDPRVLGVLAQVLLALGAGDLVDVLEDVLERRRSAAAAATAVLSPMPGTPGMLSEVSPLRP